MTVRDYWRILHEQRVVIAIAVLVGILVGGVCYLALPTQYTAKTSIYVSAQNLGANAQAAYQGAQFSAQRVVSYVELAESPRVADEVARRLRLDRAPTSQISATSTIDSVIIDIEAASSSPVGAQDMANTAAQVLQDVVTEVERPVNPGGVTPVALRVVQPASQPTSPSTFSLLSLILYGTLGGALIGVVVAFIRASVDTRVKNPEQLRDLSQLPNLAAIPVDNKIKSDAVVVDGETAGGYSRSAEAYKQLRTNLQFVNVDHQRTVLTVTSSLPGEGKSVSTLNLAMSLALAGLRVLVISGDLRRPTLASMLGLQDTVGLTTVLTGRIVLAQAVQSYRRRFDFLASGVLPPNPSELLSSESMKSLLLEARSRYDTVLIDTPPLLLVTDAAAVAPLSDGVVLLARHNQATTGQVKQAIETINTAGGEMVGTVLTAVKSSQESAYSAYQTYQSYQTDQSLTPATTENIELSERRAGRHQNVGDNRA